MATGRQLGIVAVRWANILPRSALGRARRRLPIRFLHVSVDCTMARRNSRSVSAAFWASGVRAGTRPLTPSSCQPICQHQPQDRQSPRPRHPGSAIGHRRRGDPV